MTEAKFGENAHTIVVFGTEDAMNSSRARALKDAFSKWNMSAFFFQSPAELKVACEKENFNSVVMILVVKERLPPPLTGWKAVISKIKNPPRYVIVSEHPVLETIKNDLKAELVLTAQDSLEKIRELLTNGRQNTTSMMAALVDVESVAAAEEAELSAQGPVSSLHEDRAIPAGDLKPITATQIDMPSNVEGSLLSQSLALASVDAEAAAAPAESSTPASPTPPQLTGTEMADGVDFDAEIAHSMASGEGVPNLMPDAVLSNHDSLVLEVSGASSAGGVKSIDDLADQVAVEISSVNAEASPPALPEAEKVAEVAADAAPEADVSSVSEDIADFEAEISSTLSEAGVGAEAGTVQILKKYAALKEKEIKEKDSTVETLKKQLRQMEEKLKKSDQQRRKVTVEVEDATVKIRTLEAQVEQEKNFKSKIEQDHQEQIKDYKLRLENAEFQAKRLEKKLEDFRDRIKNDIQQIRQRERELANRLELQKRDAEALIASKDERLLLQKREIDRLEFEIDSLRDRIVDDTQKSEERAQKLIRAVQSLKLAQGVLSGIEDEVLPSVAGKAGKRSSGEAA